MTLVKPRAPRAVELVVLCLAAASLALAGTTATAAPTPTLRTIEVSLVQLTVPSSWGMVMPCSDSPSCASERMPGANRSIVIAQTRPLACGAHAAANVNSVWLSRIALDTRAATTTTSISCASPGVEVKVPSLAVEIYGFGTAGMRAARSEARSGLATLLDARIQPSHPATWRSVAWPPFSVFVPSRWPTVDLRSDKLPDPGVCGGPTFFRPGAYLGVSDVVLFCPVITWASELMAAATPGNGVWMATEVPHEPFLVGGPSNAVTRRVGSVTATLSWPVRLAGSATVAVRLHAGGKAVDMVLGFGANPGVAVRILDSVRS